MKVCVIGAGPCGLTTVKQLVDEGHEVTCFEKNATIGGIWYRHENDGGEMKAYDDLILTISMKLMAYSDFIPEGERRFTDRPGYLKYLEAYADKYDLRRHITFNSHVGGVHKTDAGRWRVEVTSGERQQTHEFEAIAICTGPFRLPNKKVDHLEKFSGTVVHSAHYRNNKQFRDQRVMVIGLAESGADVVRQISDVSSECTLAIRSRPLLVTRLVLGRFPTDSKTTRAIQYEAYVRASRVPLAYRSLAGDNFLSRFLFLFAVAALRLTELAARVLLIAARGRPRRKLPDVNSMGQPLQPQKIDWGAESSPEHMAIVNEWNRKSQGDEGTWIPKIIYCKNASFVPNIATGRIKVNDSGIADIQGTTVRFKDGTVKEVDTIVLCTGFVNDFAALQGITVKDNNVRNLYKHSIHPEHGGRVAFIGFVRPFSGGIPVCAEMQARYFALLCSDKLSLPRDVARRIAKEKHWEETFTALSPRHSESIPAQTMFLDGIAKEIGCLLPWWKMLLRPKLLVKHWYYPFNQASYRLTGPHSMYEEALAEVMTENLNYHLDGWDLPLWLPLPYFVHPKWA